MRDRLKRLYNALIAWRYSIGFAEYSDAIVLDKTYFPTVHWIKGAPRKRWFADPFILSISDHEIEVLAEDYSYQEKKARISILTIDRHSYRLKHISPLISLTEHLSFPAYFRKGNKLYIYPENCRSGRLTLYEFDADSRKLERETVILQQPIADAIITEIDGKRVITGTLYPDDNGKSLFVFPFDPAEDNTNAPPLQITHFSDNTARNAGQYFHVGQQLYRPAQCCNNRYGECLVFQRINKTDHEKMTMEDIKRIYSPSKRFNLSFHTFNIFHQEMLVVDASGYRFRIIGRLLESLRNTFRR